MEDFVSTTLRQNGSFLLSELHKTPNISLHMDINANFLSVVNSRVFKIMKCLEIKEMYYRVSASIKDRPQCLLGALPFYKG